MIRYKCDFEFPGISSGRPQRFYVISSAGIGAFTHGFWINKSYELTQGTDYKYWIPPGRILLITKLEG